MNSAAGLPAWSSVGAVKLSAEAVRRKLDAALALSDWKSKYMEKTNNLMQKMEDSTTNKGTGGNVSGLRAKYKRTKQLSILLRAASCKEGAALIHGSVALTNYLETNKDFLHLLVQQNDCDFINVQNHPWVNMDHNSTMTAFHVWNDARLGVAMENYWLEKHNNQLPRTKREETNYRKEHRSLLRERMRRDVLTTVRIYFRDKDASEKYFGSDRLVLSVITYRLLPEDISNQIAASGMDDQRVIDIVTAGREKYEAYYLSGPGQTASRRMRTVPSNLLNSYFDQAPYFEQKIVPRIEKNTMSGGDAVCRVFQIENENDENECQRAFGHWLLDELKAAFGASFSKTYKEYILGHVMDESMWELFGELLVEIEKILKHFESTLEKTTKNAPVAAARKDELETTVKDDPSRPVESLFKKEEKHTTLDVLRRFQTKNREEQEQLNTGKRKTPPPTPKNASIWRHPFDSELAPIAQPARAVPAAVDIARRTGVMEALSTKCLRRTPLEELIGETIVNTATNATTNTVTTKNKASRVASAALAAAADGGEKQQQSQVDSRDVGVASRRMIMAYTNKPIPRRDFIQHTNASGLLSSINFSSKEVVRFLVQELDDDIDVLLHESEADEALPYRLKWLAQARFRMPFMLAKDVSVALQESRTPQRVNTETNNALMRSGRVLRTARKAIALSGKWLAYYYQVLREQKHKNLTQPASQK